MLYMSTEKNGWIKRDLLVQGVQMSKGAQEGSQVCWWPIQCKYIPRPTEHALALPAYLAAPAIYQMLYQMEC